MGFKVSEVAASQATTVFTGARAFSQSIDCSSSGLAEHFSTLFPWMAHAPVMGVSSNEHQSIAVLLGDLCGRFHAFCAHFGIGNNTAFVLLAPLTDRAIPIPCILNSAKCEGKIGCDIGDFTWV